MEWINELKRRMRPYSGSYCGAINCGTNQKYNSNISLFRFPKDAERSKKWLINTRRADLMKKDRMYLYNNIKICALHFEDSQFMNTQKKKLVWNAVPTLFDVPNKPPTITLKRKLPNRCTVPPKKKQKARHSRSVGVGGESSAAACEISSVKKEPADNYSESTSATAEQACETITVKVEPEAEYEDNSSEEWRKQESEYIEVKGEPLEADEATDSGGTQWDALSAW